MANHIDYELRALEENLLNFRREVQRRLQNLEGLEREIDIKSVGKAKEIKAKRISCSEIILIDERGSRYRVSIDNGNLSIKEDR